MSEMTPREIVQELDKHIIAQVDAKRAVAIALRNRWRRMNVKDEVLRAEIFPKNILMIGPTGVGKTEIARRLARLARAPFIKVEASKFTEVGYVGREVDSIVRDLLDMAIKLVREERMEKVRTRAEDIATERVLDALIRPPRAQTDELTRKQPVEQNMIDVDSEFSHSPEVESLGRQKYRKMLREGRLDNWEIEIEVGTSLGVEIFGPPGLEEMTSQLQNMLQNMGQRKTRTRKVTVKQALKLLTDEEAERMINDDELKVEAIQSVEQNGIVFLDEIDKIVGRSHSQGPDVSREGVQRDLLPLVEGSTVATRHGMVKTDHILFIASGAFQLAKPSDLIPELQGRLPIRVELGALDSKDFKKILTETDSSLTEQYHELMKTEGLDLIFEESGVEHIAEFAWRVNENTENIGARRLHTVMEKLLERLSFEAADRSGATIRVDQAFVEEELGGLVDDLELSRYIL